MDKGFSLLYRGIVKVHLQGRNALQVVALDNVLAQAEYYVGGQNTGLSIFDYRQQPILEIRKIIQQHHQNGFVKIFNQLSHAEIRYDKLSKLMKIELHDLKETDSMNGPILWMGTLENNIMPGYKVNWEVFKSREDGNIAFVAFIPQV